MRGRMWNAIEDYFKPYPARWKVAVHLIRQGLSVRDGAIRSGDIEIPAASVARACGVDRRVVAATVASVEADEFIRSVFRDLEPTLFLAKAGPKMGYGVLEIVVEDPGVPGIIHNVTSEIAKVGISIRQVVADDPRFYDPPMLTIITETPLPGELLGRIRSIDGVDQLIIR
jgi:predicted regulator of amino acid metabolism with ACT domain